MKFKMIVKTHNLNNNKLFNNKKTMYKTKNQKMDGQWFKGIIILIIKNNKKINHYKKRNQKNNQCFKKFKKPRIQILQRQKRKNQEMMIKGGSINKI